MKQHNELAEVFKEILKPENVKVNELMKHHTSFKVGGPVDILVTPENFEQVKQTITLCRNKNVPYYIVGNGTNLLVRDGGIRGVVIKLIKLNNITVNENKLTADCGVPLCLASGTALKHELSGLEFACGIPGSIGGAVAMNAGAYDGEMSHIIESVVIIDKNGEIKKLSNEQMEFDYRNSAVLKYGYIALQVTFNLKNGEHSKIKNRMDELTARRKEKQPLEYPSAGSTFKRPDGYFASKLIQDSGLKGVNVGDAQVSKKHSGFIINKGNATAKEILELIALVQAQVKEQFGVELHPEVRIVGEE